MTHIFILPQVYFSVSPLKMPPLSSPMTTQLPQQIDSSLVSQADVNLSMYEKDHIFLIFVFIPCIGVHEETC